MQYIQDKTAFCRYIYEHCHCVNAGQSSEERKAKYLIVKSLTGKRHLAYRLRDWRVNKIAQFLGYTDWKSLIETNLNRIDKND